jgi:outer membrane protein TolC
MLFAAVGTVHAADTATNTIALTIPQAVLTALARNPSVAVERMNPRLVATREGEAQASFDPVLGYGLARTESEGIRTQNFSTNRFATENETLGGGAGLGLLAPTGTKLDLSAGATNTAVNGDDGLYTARIGASVTQPLLRGAGAKDQKIRVRQARLDTRISEYEFRGFLEAFVARVERSCWDHELARRRLAIALDSLKLAEDQLAETRERIRIGALAEVEKAAAEAEVAVRLQAAIDSENALAVRRLDLARLLHPGEGRFWSYGIDLQLPTNAPEAAAAVEAHATNAQYARPEINQALLALERNRLEIVRTKNGVLPRLDVFATLGRSGYADSLTGAVQAEDDDGYDFTVGLSGEWPIGRRADKARLERAVLTRDQTDEALANLRSLIEADVRGAYLEVERTAAQQQATASTAKLQEEKLRAETEKFRVGKSTSLLVAQVQRDAALAQLDVVRAEIQHRQALIDLYRLDGSLLARRGLDAPGGEPVQRK